MTGHFTGIAFLDKKQCVPLAKRCKKLFSFCKFRFSLLLGVIPKSTKEEHIVGNFDIFDFLISEEDMERLNSMNIDKHYCWDPSLVS